MTKTETQIVQAVKRVDPLASTFTILNAVNLARDEGFQFVGDFAQAFVREYMG